MSMFDLVFADPIRQERMGILLALLAHDQPDEQEAESYVQPLMGLRLRDMWVEKSPDGPPVLAVYTRNGGGNRAHDHDSGEHCLGCHGEAATRHPLYLRDADDDFDCTYRTYWFAFPDTLEPDIQRTLDEVAVEPRNMSEEWQEAIAAIGGQR